MSEKVKWLDDKGNVVLRNKNWKPGGGKFPGFALIVLGIIVFATGAVPFGVPILLFGLLWLAAAEQEHSGK